MMTNQATTSAPDGAYEGPDRWLLDNDVEDDPSWYDELGFLVPSRVPGRRHLREALGPRVVMIVGEPWAGKTFVSRHLEAAAVRCGGRAFLLSLEERRQNYSPRWIGDGDLTRGLAWCVIDAADEGVYSGISVVEVLETVRAAEPVASALRVVVLSRNDASLNDVHANVERVFGPCPVMRLLPMDRCEARRGLTEETWQRLCAHLANPLLRQFARYHVATTFLAGREGDVVPADVWRGMLEALCEEKRLRGGPPLRTTASARVRAAERFAAVSLLARHRAIELDRPGGRLLPHDLFPRNDEQLRVAARELRYTSLLKRTADGEYRFRYRFAEEILAALATSSVTPESLHSLVTGPDGKLRDDLTQYAATFAALNGPDRPVLVADGNRVSRFSRDEVRDWVDRLVAAAGRVTTWIKGQDMLRWLNVGGLEDDLASRVSNRTLASGGRQVLFDIAQVNRIAGSFADNALTIVLSNDEDIELRERAVYYLSDLGSLVHIQGLTALASAAPSSSSVLRARALRVLLERGLERPLRVASLAERPEPHHYDARAALVSAIEAALTHEEALLLVQSWTDEVRAAELPSIDEAILEELREAAVKLLASQRDAEAADVDALVSLFLDDERTANHRGVSAEIDDAFRNKKELRRVAFASLDDRPYRVDRFISQDDFSWLIEDGTTTGARKYVATIYRLRASGVLGPGATSEATAFLEARADVLAELDRDWAEAEASRQEWLRRHPPREPQTRRALRDVLRTVLESDMPPSNRLRALGAYCFATEGWARSDITGSFDELQDDERAAVIAAMVAALPAASPTPIPDAGSSFPVAILYEAAAVAALVLRRQDVRSDTATVERWLPTLLFDLREEIAAAVSYLIEDHGELAEVAAAGAIRRELRAQSEHVHIAYSLPPELWTARFVRVVSALVRDASYATASRRALLLCLPEHAHEEGARKEVLAAVEDCFSTDELRAAALECLAALDPRGSWPRLRAALRTERDLTILRPWFDRHRTPAIAIDDVADVPFMEDVIAHFFAVLGHEPEDLGPRVVTPADDARALRTRFLDRLISDPSPEAVAAVERLAVLDPTIGRWKEQFVANCDIRSVLEELEVRWLPSPRDVVRVLDESLFRFLRSEADLHRLAREILANHIGASVGNDIDMFWFRPTGGEESKAREAALQAYVRRRLEDLLPLYSPVARVELPREQQVQRRRRFDVLIITALPEQRLGSVVIEIKWSHDARVRKALRDQLVKSYLLGEGRSHGLYVVGMTGADRNSAKLLRDLQTRRDDCLREHPSLTIDVVALPCQWSDGGDNAAGGSEEGVPSGSGSRRGKKTATRTRAKAKAAMKVKAKPKAKTKMAPARKSTKKSKRTARRPTEPSRSPRGRQ